MVAVRPSTLCASASVGVARAARAVRPVQHWKPLGQYSARRAYASRMQRLHEGRAIWFGYAAAITVFGLWIVVSQDLGHGGHSDHHDADSQADAEEHEEHNEAESGQHKTASEDQQPEANPTPTNGDKADDSPSTSETSAVPRDKPDAAKPAVGLNEMSGKQEGISNADTRHSTARLHDESQSKKGEGVADSAKLKGTVSTDRPQAGSSQRGSAVQDKSK